MKAMILAAGKGMRLKPFTDTMPKALVEIDGTPLLRILLDKLIRAGATDITVNVHHFAEQIEAFLSTYPANGVTLRISDERAELLETGGALKHAVPLLTADNPAEPVLLHNVDILSNVNLKAFYANSATSEATLLVSERETNRYLLFSDEMRLMGWTNVETGEVRSPYAGLDVAACRRFAFSGIHVFSPRLFPRIANFPSRFSIIDFYLKECAAVPIRGFLAPGLRLLDVGKLTTLPLAEAFLRDENDSLAR